MINIILLFKAFFQIKINKAIKPINIILYYKLLKLMLIFQILYNLINNYIIIYILLKTN